MPINLFLNPLKANASTAGSTPSANQPVNLLAKTGDTPAAAPTGLEDKLRADQGFGSQVGAEQVAGVKKITGSISKGAEDMKKGSDQGAFTLQGAGNIIKGGAEAAFGTVAGAARTVLAPVGVGVSKLLGLLPHSEGAAGLLKNPEIAKSYNAIGTKLQDFATRHPDATTLTEDIANTLLLAAGAGAGEGVAKSALADVASKDAAIGAAKSIKEGVPEIASKIKNAVVKPQAPEAIAGKIIQGTSEDQAAAMKALSNADVSGVKTYKDLSGVLDKKIAADAKALDEKLAANTKTTKLKNLSLKETANGKTVAHNYVQDAISQLKEHYAATNDNVGLARMQQLEASAKADGLTVKQLNDLAREHGNTINAFNANGQAAAGLSKQAAENTRVGVKDTAKSIFGDTPENKALFDNADKSLSDSINTRNLVNKVDEAVTKATQKVADKGWGQKIGGLVFKIGDFISAGGVKGFLKTAGLTPEGTGTMNPIALEKALSKNLSRLQDALDSKTAAEAERKLNGMLEDISFDGSASKKGSIKGAAESLPTIKY